MSIVVEIALVYLLIGFLIGGLVSWRVMLRTMVADAHEVSMDLMREQEATEWALMIFVGHIKGGQYWSPRMQKIYNTWEKEMNHDEDAITDEA